MVYIESSSQRYTERQKKRKKKVKGGGRETSFGQGFKTNFYLSNNELIGLYCLAKQSRVELRASIMELDSILFLCVGMYAYVYV